MNIADFVLRYFLGGMLMPLIAGVPSYTIHTIAGSDNVGDGGAATAAFVSILEGVCADSAGNVYVADADDNRIRRIDAAGTITTYAGTGFAGSSGDGGPANQATLRNPYGIRMDGGGNLFIADLGNGRIRKVSVTGTITTVASGLNQPRNLTFDSTGRLYVSEFSGQRVSRVEDDGTLQTVAGNGNAGFSGDGGPAAWAELNEPAGIALDSTGNLYIADSGNQLIRRVSATGNISTFWGSDATATLTAPTGLATDAQGNVYVAQAGYPSIFSVDTNGNRHILPGIGRDLFVTGKGILLAAGNQHLEFIHPDGNVTSLFSTSSYIFGDGGPATSGRFESVSAVVPDANGNVVIADAAFHRLRMVTASGVLATLPASDSVTAPRGLAFDKSGRMFIADQTAVLMANGTDPVVDFVNGLKTANAVATGSDGTVYFTDGSGLFSADTAGNVTAIPYSAPLPTLSGVAVDSSGAVYVADSARATVSKLGPGGKATVVAGTGTAGFGGDGGTGVQAQLSSPVGIAFDRTGNLWIADSGNNRVRVLDASGVIHTAAGTGTAGTAGDGGNATAAQLSVPVAVASDSHGNVFIADAGSRRIRELAVGGTTGAAAGNVVTPTHAATFQAGPVAGGEMVSLFGTNLGPSAGLSAVLDSSGKVATLLGDTEVLVNSVAAPLYYVGSGQINAQIPVEVSGQVSAVIEVRRSGKTQATAIADITPYTPGLFGLNGFAAALNQDGSFNSAEEPVAAGQVIVLFGTGFGDTSPLEQTGEPAGIPLPIPLAQVSVTIDGKAATILYAGDAPGFAGLTQINATVPAGVQAGKAEVRVATANVWSPAGLFLHTR